MAPRADLLDVLDAAYRIDDPEDIWLKSVADAALPHLDRGFGMLAFTFRRHPGRAPRILGWHLAAMPDELAAAYPSMFLAMNPKLRERPFELGPFVTGSQLMSQGDDFRDDPLMKKHAQRFGIYDSIWITAAEPSGLGMGFHAGRRDITRADGNDATRWSRIAAHLSNALRLRQRIQTSEALAPDAVIEPSGRVLHAAGKACAKSAREILRRAVLALDRARGPQRLKAPDKSLEQWPALVSGRWSILEQIQHEGRRYFVARENEPDAPGPSSLTPRQRQILSYLALGHEPKLIAYDLGIAHSTVRVLLGRAKSTLGARTRAELLQTFRDLRS